jgi:uncharacterized membrane protein YfcA
LHPARVTTILLLTAAIFLMAALYSSVGHAGASGYLAAMALFAVEPALMKPTALTLNILVALIASVRFYRAGYFSWRVLLPFAITSVPFAFVGGSITLPGHVYQRAVGAVLLFAAVRLWTQARAHASADSVVSPAPVWLAALLGAGIGLLSGMTGVGGGIFLSPLLLLAGWAETRQTSGVSAAFILVNSVAGLAGHVSGAQNVPAAIYPWGAAAVCGGLVGTELGRRRLATVTLRRLLAAVLVIAGLKLLLT